MQTINRSAFVVLPREPYLAWAASLDSGERTAADDVASRIAVYLAAEGSNGEDDAPPLEDYFTRIFECELEAWSTDRAEWPEPRDFLTFVEWFDTTGESIVVDLEDTPIETEEL